MFFHEFGQDGVPPLHLGFEVFDLAIFGIVDGLALATVVESGVAVVKKILQPPVDLRRVKLVLVAQVRDRNLLDEVLLE